MPSLVIRRTKVISDKIEDLTIEDRDVGLKQVSRGKLTYLTQIGSGKPGYVSFPTAYSVEPGVVVSPIYDVTALGYIPEVTSVDAGSFNVTGSAGGYVRYIAVGSA